MVRKRFFEVLRLLFHRSPSTWPRDNSNMLHDLLVARGEGIMSCEFMPHDEKPCCEDEISSELVDILEYF